MSIKFYSKLDYVPNNRFMKKFFAILFSAFCIAFLVNAQNITGPNSYKLVLKSDNLLVRDHNQLITTNEVYNFNPVYKEDLCITKGNFFQGIIENPSTLFLAFSSDTGASKQILKIETGRSELDVFSDKVVIDDEKTLSYIAGNGSILTCNINLRKSKKKNNLVLCNDFLSDSVESNNRLLEMIYFTEPISFLVQQQLETYLSIKYGISLTGRSNYFNSNGDLLWSSDSNNIFKHDLTAIAIDRGLGLVQKQSHNSCEKWLTIGVGEIESLNFQNLTIVDDNTYIMWANNGKSFHFTSDTLLTYSITERKWKMTLHNAVSKDITGQVKLNYNSAKFDKTSQDIADKFWLILLKDAQTQLFDGLFYPGITDTVTMEALFSDIVFSFANDYYFTMIKAPEFFALHSVDSTCNYLGYSNVKIRVIGGIAPFQVTVKTRTEKRSSIYLSDEIKLDNIRLDEPIEILITDKHGSEFEFKIPARINPGIEIINSVVCQLDESDHTYIYNPDFLTTAYQFEWRRGTEVLAITPGMDVSEPGIYNLTIADDKGCKITMDFNVKPFEKQANNQIKIYPNPVKSSAPFMMSFDMAPEEAKTVYIFDIDGRIIFTKKMETGFAEEFETTIYQPGSYLVVIRTKDNSLIHKLIVL